MASLRSLIGQARAVEVLVAAVASGRAHHAYLFDGPEGVGKQRAARALAAALNCEARDPAGCGACGSCVKVEEGLHPDVIAVDMTPKGLTDRMRELVALGGFLPHEGRARVVILDPADALAGPQEGRAEAANALLKTLEEPPARTHFVLVTAEARRLPLTVRSRCQRVRFLPLSDGEVARWLVSTGIRAATADELAARAGGSIARAQALSGSDDDGTRARTLAEALLRGAGKGLHEVKSALDGAGDVGWDRDAAELACRDLWDTLRDGLFGAEEIDGAARPGELRLTRARTLLGERTAPSLLSAIRKTEDCLEALRGNVAPTLALEHLALGLWGAA